MNTIFTKNILTPIGEMFVGATNKGICLLDFCHGKYLARDVKFLAKTLQATVVEGESQLIIELEQQLGEYFAGNRFDFSVPLIFKGTAFQVQAWEVLQRIPYGKTISYREQAVMIGKPKAVRAVANANGSNRIAIIVPCHRVIGADGSLTGYGGGLHIKKNVIGYRKEIYCIKNCQYVITNVN